MKKSNFIILILDIFLILYLIFSSRTLGTIKGTIIEVDRTFYGGIVYVRTIENKTKKFYVFNKKNIEKAETFLNDNAILSYKKGISK